MTEIPSSSSRTAEPIDSAALAGATMAAVLAVVIPKGPFDIISIPIGVALVLVILAYEGAKTRHGLIRRLSFAASTGFALVLVVGPFIELFLHGGNVTVFLNGGTEANGLVKPWMNAASWLALSAGILVIDWRWQERRRSLG